MWDVERLKQLWAEGFSATEIGRDMGKTRNAVLGKVFRLRLEGHEFKERQVYSPPNSGPKGSIRRRNVDGPQPTTNKLKLKRLPDKYQAIPHEPQSGGIEFMDRGKFQCAYITSGDREQPTMCCGDVVVDGTSWCATHYQICFTEPRNLSDEVRQRQRHRMLTKIKPVSRLALAGNQRVATYDEH